MINIKLNNDIFNAIKNRFSFEFDLWTDLTSSTLSNENANLNRQTCVFSKKRRKEKLVDPQY